MDTWEDAVLAAVQLEEASLSDNGIPTVYSKTP
jgi:hypothetical protein